jgi:hypothetical protein
MFGHAICRIVCRPDGKGIQRVLHRYFLALLKGNMGGAASKGKYGIVGDDDYIVKTAALQCQERGHYLCCACRAHFLVHIFFKKNLARIGVD